MVLLDFSDACEQKRDSSPLVKKERKKQRKASQAAVFSCILVAVIDGYFCFFSFYLIQRGKKSQ